ncbi:MAG: zinc ribbon domain-containing protein [Candidatus Riflebacteria bacterium]|nr:zinc ribbon domain-containing protein [Candidatus Riflebacteria bacterium]
MKIREMVFILLVSIVAIAPAWGLYCPYCQAKAVEDAKFCAQCGKPLPAPEEIQPAPARRELIPDPIPVPSPVLVPSPAPIPTPIPAPIARTGLAPHSFMVTSNYLSVNGSRITYRSIFWIADINDDQARVWWMDWPHYYTLIMGWVPLAELERRTTFRPAPFINCVEPPPPSARLHLVPGHPWWYGWTPQPAHRRFPDQHHMRGHDERPRYH